MTPDEIRASNERALESMRQVIQARKTNLEIAERHFRGSEMEALSRRLLESAYSDYAALEASVARVEALISLDPK